MLSETQKLPDDPAQLRKSAEQLLALVKSQAVQIAKLQHQLDGHKRQRFGSTSDAADQLNLLLEETEIALGQTSDATDGDNDDNEADKAAKGKPKRKLLPKNLPRNKTELSPGETCGDCGGHLRTLGEDVTEELEYIPGRFVVNRLVRPRKTCSCCDAIVQAPLPSRPIERGRPPSHRLQANDCRATGSGPVGTCANFKIWRLACRFCDRAGLVKSERPTSRSLLLSVVGMPPQDADCGGREAPNLYLVLMAPGVNPSSSRPSSLLRTSHRHPQVPDFVNLK